MIIADFSNIGKIFKKEKEEEVEYNDVFGVIDKRIKKYDEKQIKLFIPKVISKLIKMIYYAKKDNDKMLEKTFDEFFDTVRKLLPIFDDGIHYTYEAYKQMEENYSFEELLQYVKDHGEDPVEFASKYGDTKNKAMNLMIAMAILEKNGITLETFNDANMAKKLLSGESRLDILDEEFEGLDSESRKVLGRIFEKEMPSYTEFGEEYLELAEAHHQDYMSKNVYPYLPETNSKIKDKDRVLNLVYKTHKGKQKK